LMLRPIGLALRARLREQQQFTYSFIGPRLQRILQV